MCYFSHPVYRYETNIPTIKNNIVNGHAQGTWRKAGTSFHFSSRSTTGLASSC